MTKENNIEVPFEKMLQDLDSIVKQLESGKLSLEDSLKAYETGVATVRQAQGKLEGMEGRIEKLMADGSKQALQDS